MKHVGIYSGTFDPIHDGHLAFADQAIARCKLDKVWFLAEPRPRRKQGVRALEHRTRMIQLAIRNHPEFGSIILDQARFTPHETLPVLQNRFKNARLYMLMGEDMLRHLADWPHINELVGAVHLIIGCRQHSPAHIRRQMKTINEVRGLKFSFTIIKTSSAAVSSSQVKPALRRGQIPSGVPEPVARYIKKLKLYLPDTDV